MLCIYIYNIDIYIYIYIYTYIYIMIFNVVLRYFDLRYKVSLTWGSNPQSSDFHSNALPTELVSLTQG